MTSECLDAGIVIVGGGAAGAKAAIDAHEKGLQPLIISKGLLGKSGCSIFAGHILMGGDSKRDMLEMNVRYLNHYLVDQDYILESGQWLGENFFREFEGKGIYFRRGKKGELVTSQGPVRVGAAHKQGANGVLLMDLRRREILAKKIPLLEETVVTSILTADGGAVGVTALDMRTGAFYVVRAKAVILATGSSDGLSVRSTATREQSADGLAMAIRAGAELQNLEIHWWHVCDTAEPRAWMRLHNYPNPLMGTAQTARLENALGDVFFEQKRNPISIAPYTDQIRRLAQQVEGGRAAWDGKYFVSYAHIEQQEILPYIDTLKFWIKRRLDPGKDKVECGITQHYRQGGIHTNPRTMETSLSGLYAPGAVGGHNLGGFGPVTYDAMLAVQSAEHRAHRTGWPSIDDLQIQREKQRVCALLRPRPDGGVSPMEVKNHIRRIMWEQMSYVKNEKKMNMALARLGDVRREVIPQMGLPNVSRNFNTAWIDALDVMSMLDVCEATVHSAKHRCESRGPFFREDYPYSDNKNWLRKVIMKKLGDEIQFTSAPYEMKYVQPRRDLDPFFDTATDY